MVCIIGSEPSLGKSISDEGLVLPRWGMVLHNLTIVQTRVWPGTHYPSKVDVGGRLDEGIVSFCPFHIWGFTAENKVLTFPQWHATVGGHWRLRTLDLLEMVFALDTFAIVERIVLPHLLLEDVLHYLSIKVAASLFIDRMTLFRVVQQGFAIRLLLCNKFQAGLFGNFLRYFAHIFLRTSGRPHRLR